MYYVQSNLSKSPCRHCRLYDPHAILLQSKIEMLVGHSIHGESSNKISTPFKSVFWVRDSLRW